MKKYLALFIFILLCILPLSAFSTTDFSYSFENTMDCEMWSGGVSDDSNPYSGEFSLFLSNPFGEIRNGRVSHVLDYSPTVFLQAGKVYSLSGYVMDPLGTRSSSLRARASRGNGANTVLVSISGIGEEWAQFSTTFYVGKTGEYNLSLHFMEGYADFGFFVDEITLEEVPCILSSLNIAGQNEILIPATSSVTYEFRPYLLSSDGSLIDIISSESVHFEINTQEGISFNPSEYSLTVTSEAIPESTVRIGCSLQNYTNLPPTSFEVLLYDNMIENPTFDDDTLLWTAPSKAEILSDETNRFLSVSTGDYGEFGYFGTAKYQKEQLLLKDALYVIRAKVKSDTQKPFFPIHTKNSSTLKNNTITFTFKDISGTEWINVFAAFIPEQSGIYDIEIDLCSMYDCTIFVDDIKLSCETLAPEYITLHAPGNIAVPDVETKLPVSALLRDQLGNILGSEDIKITLLKDNEHIDFDSDTNTLTVYPDTPTGKYTLGASYIQDSKIQAKLDIILSFDYIGDGTFENTIPNEWWMVSSPGECDFYIRHDGTSRRALVNCKDSYFMLLNNSYVHLVKNIPYVFNLNFSSPVNCTGTLFIETLENEMIPLAQFPMWAGSTLDEKAPPELFLAEEDCTGRLFLYVESDSAQSFSIYLDNLSLKKASIVAVNPSITGIPYVNGAVEAQFTLYNNIAENSDTSACAINWYVSDSFNGEYTEVPNAEKNIYFDTTYLNKYVYFEITPICPITGFSGSTTRSLPFMITYDTSETAMGVPMFTPIVKRNNSEEDFFADTQNHWGKDYINRLAISGVVNGKTENCFMPDAPVTRAEFSKMLSIAFTVNTLADLPLFDDVHRSDWHYPYITALYLASITNGTAPGTFSPDAFLSREEAVSMLVRLYEKASGTQLKPSSDTFTDEAIISNWAKDAVLKSLSLGIIQGNPDGSFAPGATLTRAQASAFICRLADKLK